LKIKKQNRKLRKHCVIKRERLAPGSVAKHGDFGFGNLTPLTNPSVGVFLHHSKIDYDDINK
jgi:hypothetical protein